MLKLLRKFLSFLSIKVSYKTRSGESRVNEVVMSISPMIGRLNDGIRLIEKDVATNDAIARRVQQSTNELTKTSTRGVVTREALQAMLEK